MFPTTVGTLWWLVDASVSARAVEARVGGGVVVWVSTYSADRGVLASTVVVSKLLAEFALVAWAGREVFLRLMLFSKDRYSIL